MFRLKKSEKVARKEAEEHDHSGHHHPEPEKPLAQEAQVSVKIE